MMLIPVSEKTSYKYFSLLAVVAALVLATSAPYAQDDQESKQPAAAVLEKILEDQGVEEARKRFQELKADEENYDFDATAFIGLGHGLYRNGKIPGAVAILEMTVELFPEARMGHFLLGCAYWKSGKPGLALKSRLDMKAMEEKAALAELLESQGDSLFTTAKEVIENYLEAIGGREALEGVRTMVVKFGVNSTGGNSIKMTRYYKRPGFYRQGVVGSDRFTATDGETVWSVRGDEWSVNDDQAIRRMNSIEGNFIGYAERGISYEFFGVEIFNHTPVYHLKRTFWDGFEQELYFSVESGYLTEIESEYPQSYPMMRSVMSLWDYRDVGGIKIPHVFIRNVNELGPPHGGVIEDVRLNVPLDDSHFVKPR